MSRFRGGDAVTGSPAAWYHSTFCREPLIDAEPASWMIGSDRRAFLQSLKSQAQLDETHSSAARENGGNNREVPLSQSGMTVINRGTASS